MARTGIGAKEAAAILEVSPSTVTRWAKKGQLGYFRTPGGVRRFRRADVMRLLARWEAEAAGDGALDGSDGKAAS